MIIASGCFDKQESLRHILYYGAENQVGIWMEDFSWYLFVYTELKYIQDSLNDGGKCKISILYQ